MRYKNIITIELCVFMFILLIFIELFIELLDLFCLFKITKSSTRLSNPFKCGVSIKKEINVILIKTNKLFTFINYFRIQVI